MRGQKLLLKQCIAASPVVCFKNTSISEIVDHKINGYVVENFNANELKDGIDWLSDEVKNPH